MLFPTLLLNPFPSLLDFSLFAPLILRIGLGALFLYFGVTSLRRMSPLRKSFVFLFLNILEVIGALCLLIGFQVQTFAIMFAIFSLGFLFLKTLRPFEEANRPLYFLLLAVSLSLIVSGPGIFALGLPL